MSKPFWCVIECETQLGGNGSNKWYKGWMYPSRLNLSGWSVTTDKLRAQIFETKDEAAKAKNELLNGKEPPKVSRNFKIVEAS